MSELPPPPPAPVPPAPTSNETNPWLLALGILFILGWIGLHVLWAAMSGMANLMANDSGAASTGAQMSLIFGALGGQILAGAAGIPAGLAFFWRGRRKMLLGAFAVLFVLGAGIQIVAFWSFFAKMS